MTVRPEPVACALRPCPNFITVMASLRPSYNRPESLREWYFSTLNWPSAAVEAGVIMAIVSEMGREVLMLNTVPLTLIIRDYSPFFPSIY